MDSTKELFLQAMCEKHGGDFEAVKNYIEIFNDMLREINFTSSFIVYRTYTLEEIETLSFKIFKQYMINHIGIPCHIVNEEIGSVKIGVNLNLY